MVSKGEGGVSRGISLQIKLLSSAPGAAEPRCHPSSSSLSCAGLAQHGQAAGGDAASGGP